MNHENDNRPTADAKKVAHDGHKHGDDERTIITEHEHEHHHHGPWKLNVQGVIIELPQP